MFANDEGILDKKLPFKISVDPDRAVEFGLSFELDALAKEGVALILEEELLFFIDFFSPPHTEGYLL